MIDVVLALLGLVIFSPLFLALAVIIKLDSPGPVFFKQKRIGMHKACFNMLKFRTMRTDTPKDTPTHLLENPEQWISRTGKVMRKLSLDELPQIWNILTAKMSIIGPRPALWNQGDLIAERDKYGANDVRPGLTGWAQINGRDELPIVVKAKLDGDYVKNMSFCMDCKCFFGTVKSVLKRDGVVEGGIAEKAETVENFAEREETAVR
ncbi:MAG: sugar transferase [Oscillospiraceae bacterium]|nr:sugar transferase [Oscillospiraceae bacterium]